FSLLLLLLRNLVLVVDTISYTTFVRFVLDKCSNNLTYCTIKVITCSWLYVNTKATEECFNKSLSLGAVVKLNVNGNTSDTFFLTSSSVAKNGTAKKLVI